ENLPHAGLVSIETARDDTNFRKQNAVAGYQTKNLLRSYGELILRTGATNQRARQVSWRQRLNSRTLLQKKRQRLAFFAVLICFRIRNQIACLPRIRQALQMSLIEPLGEFPRRMIENQGKKQSRREMARDGLKDV